MEVGSHNRGPFLVTDGIDSKNFRLVLTLVDEIELPPLGIWSLWIFSIRYI